MPKSMPSVPSGVSGAGVRNIQRYSKVEDTPPIDQVCLPLDGTHTGFLVGTETKGNQHSTRECQEGNGVNALKVHDARVIDYAPSGLNVGLNALSRL